MLRSVQAEQARLRRENDEAKAALVEARRQLRAVQASARMPHRRDPAGPVPVGAPGPVSGFAPVAPRLVSPRAVSGVVGTVEGGAGGFRAGEGGYAAGSLAFPIGRSFGFQADLAAMANGGELGLGAAGRAFLRDPAKGLIGLYGSVDYASAVRSYGVQDVGTTRGRVAVEGALFLNRFTLDGIAGWQLGADADRFFDQVDLSWYATDDLRFSIGHRYENRIHAVAAGAEYLLPLASPVGVRRGPHREQQLPSRPRGSARLFRPGGQVASAAAARRHPQGPPDRRLRVAAEGLAYCSGGRPAGPDRTARPDRCDGCHRASGTDRRDGPAGASRSAGIDRGDGGNRSTGTGRAARPDRSAGPYWGYGVDWPTGTDRGYGPRGASRTAGSNWGYGPTGAGRWAAARLGVSTREP